MRSLALALLLLAAPAGAATIVLDFEADALATHEDPFQPAGCGGCVTLQEAQGRQLQVRVFDGSQALLIGEEGGALLLNFSVPVVGVSLDFGGDWDTDEIRSGIAVLTGIVGGLPMVLDWATPNRNRAIDQTLSITFAEPLAQAIFTFPQLGEHEPASSLVDRIVLTTVPEPGTLGLLGLAAVVGSVVVRPIRGKIRPVS